MAFVAVVGSFIAGAGATGVVAGSAVTAGIIGGAAIGAVVGGVVSAVKGDNILKGALTGGIIGAAGGALIGASSIGQGLEAAAASSSGTGTGLTSAASLESNFGAGGTLSGSGSAPVIGTPAVVPPVEAPMSAGTKLALGSTAAQVAGGLLDNSADKKAESDKELQDELIKAKRATTEGDIAGLPNAEVKQNENIAVTPNLEQAALLADSMNSYRLKATTITPVQPAPQQQQATVTQESLLNA